MEEPQEHVSQGPNFEFQNVAICSSEYVYVYIVYMYTSGMFTHVHSVHVYITLVHVGK